jgi:hypothetical protein
MREVDLGDHFVIDITPGWRRYARNVPGANGTCTCSALRCIVRAHFFNSTVQLTTITTGAG